MPNSTPCKPRRKQAHSPDTGQFVGATPLNDPALLVYLMERLQAIEMLTPTLLALAHGAGASEQASRLMLQTLGGLLLVRESINEAVIVDARRGSGNSGEVDIQRLVSGVQARWRKLFEALPAPEDRPSVGIGKGAQ